MHSYILISFLIILFNALQMNAQSLNGRYTLQGVPEMAAEFNFNETGQFQFWYVYGGSDRMAEGTYELHGDTVKLNSTKSVEQDFPILHQSKKGSGYTIQVRDDNAFLLGYVIAHYGREGNMQVAESDENGKIIIPSSDCETIWLQHRLFPDAACKIKDKDNTNTYFEVGLSPTLMQVSFKGIDFFLKDDTLICYPNYFMPMDGIRFVKQ